MNPQTITLTSDDDAGFAWAVQLTGLSLEEIVNLLLEDLVDQFDPDSRDEFMENYFGAWRYKTRRDAERVLEWVKSRNKIVESAIRQECAGFMIDANTPDHNGEPRRICRAAPTARTP